MKIGLKEKLWFGKHKDERLIDVIKNNPKYIKKLLDEYDVQLSDDAYKYYEKQTTKSSIGYGGGYTTTYGNPF